MKDSFVAYLDPAQDKIKGVLLFDSMLTVHSSSKRVVISNASRRYNVVQCLSISAALWF